MNDSIDTLRQRLQQLKALHDEGTLSAEAHAEARAPLERLLLDRVMVDAPSVVRPSRRLVGLSATAVVALAVAGYAAFGSPSLPSAGAPGSAAVAAGSAAPQLSEQEFIAAVEKLAARMKEEPNNGEGWGLLARSYVRLGKHADAVPAFAQAVAIVGDDPSLLVDYADALAMTRGRVLEGEPLALVDRALKSDPDNGKALALSGTAAFNRKDYKLAVQQWERLARVSPPDSAFLPQLQSSIDEARSLAGMPAGERVGAAVAGAGAATGPAGAGSAAASGALLTGTVRLSPALARQAQPDDVVFIFARPAEGARMPLAILRHQVKDLPVSFKLDDSMAMSPAMKLSAYAKVVVTARVSKSGQAAPGPGDLSGQSAAVANQTQGLVVEINEVVKP